MIQCRYCGRSCGCHPSDPCVCTDSCYECDVKPDGYEDYYDEFLSDMDDGGES